MPLSNSFFLEPSSHSSVAKWIKQYGWRTERIPSDLFIARVNSSGLLQVESLVDTGTQPLIADWTMGGLSPQQVRSRYQARDPWLKALGSPSECQHVLDCTLGLGFDTSVMALLGFQVTGFERHSLVFELAQQAHEKLPLEWLKVREAVRLEYGDFRSAQNLQPDIVYLDPMYPAKRKTALAKKDLRWLRDLVGDDPDSGEIFAAARAIARRKVVVKRPLKAEPLADGVTATFRGHSTRYDVYYK